MFEELPAVSEILFIGYIEETASAEVCCKRIIILLLKS